MKKHIRNAVIFLVIVIIFEALLFGYGNFVNYFFEKMHLTGNTPMDITMEEIKLSKIENDTYLEINKKLEGVYNITLLLKEKNEDTYMRILYDQDRVSAKMEKANLDGTKYNKYFIGSGATLENVKIAFSEAQLSLDKIQAIRINDNITFTKTPEFSVIEILKLYLVVMAIYAIIQTYIAIKKSKKDIGKEKVFLVAALVIGAVFNIVILPLSRYDDHAHFWRIYEISSGNLVSKVTNEFPKSVKDLIIDEDGVYHINDITYSYMQEKAKLKLNKDEKEPLAVGLSSGASPISYLPQLVGVTIGRVLQLNPLTIAYLGRIANFIAYLIIMYWAIKLLPKDKWKNIFIIIALLPMTMNMAMSLSPDAMIISVSFLAISYMLHLKYKAENVGWKQAAIIGALCMLPTVCKTVYFPLVFLFFMIPKDKFKNKMTRWGYFAGIVVFCLGVYSVWQRFLSSEVAAAIHTNATEQFFYAIADPMRTLMNLINTINTYISEFIFPMIGGWNTNHIVSVGFIVLLLIATFAIHKKADKPENEEVELERKDRIIMGLISIIVILLSFAGMYVLWTEATKNVIDGVQGRYFLPILPLIMLALERNTFTYDIKNRNKKCLFAILVLYIPVVIFSICTYL